MEEHKLNIQTENFNFEEKNKHLRQRKIELAKLIAETENLVESGEPTLANNPVDPIKQGAELKTKADILAKKEQLSSLFQRERSKVDDYEKKIDERIAQNIRNMERRRTQVYRDFEKRFAADTGKMEGDKGPRYAKAKRELDAQAQQYRQRVEAQNAKLLHDVAAMRNKLASLEEKINDQMDAIDRLSADPRNTDSNRELMQNLDQLIADAAQVHNAGQSPDLLQEENAHKLIILREEMINLDKTIKIAEKEQQEKLAIIDKQHASQTETLFMYGGIGAFALLLLIFVSSLMSKLS